MTQPGAFTPYSTVKPWLTTPPSWVPPTDQDRISAYQLYEELYWSHVATTYKVMTRDTQEDSPIYVPTSRIIVETMNRYVGKDMTVTVQPESGSPATRTLAQQQLAALFARERFDSRYDGNKRYGIIRGDWCWHILADPNKAPGTRLRILPVDPASYYPIYDDNDQDRILGVHLAERILRGDTFFVKRQTYRKTDTGRITSETAIFEEDAWFEGDAKAVEQVENLHDLDPLITAIPVYHIPNFYAPNDPWGSSDLRGLETVAAGINQSVTDGDLALALMGLGVYATDQPGTPIDPQTGLARDWFIYPGAVIENSKGLRKVEGVTNMAGYDSHIPRLWQFMQEAAGANPAAMGRVEVDVAESGVALFLQLAPVLSKATEKDRLIKDVHTQMMYDLQRWFQVYEGVNFTDVLLVPTFGDKLPTNKKAEADLVSVLMSIIPPVLSAQSARSYLASKGFAEMFAEDEGDRVMAEMAQAAAAQQGTDAAGERAAIEAADAGAVAEAGGSTAVTGTEG
jgi:hypothetical protein